MKKLYFNLISGYHKKDIFCLAHELGKNLSNFLGEDIFKLLLDSKVLINNGHLKSISCVSDETYQLHPAAKALEGFLKKLIKGHKLQEKLNDPIGVVFGKKDLKVRKKIKDKRLIAKTKTVWDFCRNDIMHFSNEKRDLFEMLNKYNEIVGLIKLLYKDFYGKTEPDEDIKKGFKKYFLKKI